MNLRKILLLVVLLLLLPFAFKAKGQDFGKTQSLFTDIKAHKVGDIVTVLIYEQSQASQQIQTKTEKSGDMSTSGGPGIGPLLRAIPAFSVDGKQTNNFDGKGQNTRQGSLRGKIAVTVTAVKDNGDLVVQGTRVIGISNDRETMTLSGTIRPKDIGADNSIDSYQIADAEIRYTGKGSASNGSRPGFLSRLFSWLF
jgi:flagellar L-ring protein FlgH